MSAHVDEREVASLAHQIAALGSRTRTGVYHMSWWSDKVLQWAMSHKEFKTQLFRLVDTLPALGDDEDIIADYLDQYFSGVDIPRLVDMGLGLADRVPGGHRLSSTITRRNVERMARQFIAGEDDDVATERIHQLWRNGMAATVDLLGEHTCSNAEADAYASRVSRLLTKLVSDSVNWAHDDHLERDEIGAVPRVSISIKSSALTTAFAPLTIERAVDEAEARLLPILESVADGSASVYLDMESYETKEVVHALLARICANKHLAGLHLGIVVQAYLKDASSDLERLVALSASRPTPLWVRLVKGAYWDTETIVAGAQGWPNVVFEEKDQTDESFERCVRYLHLNRESIRCAFASHNLRSIAYVIASGRAMGIPDTGYELQLLYGMAEPVHTALRSMGARLRIYAPVGALVPGMAYLVRRLLENTSNESFVRLRFAEGQKLGSLLAPPGSHDLPSLPPVARRTLSDLSRPSEYLPEPPMEWRRREVREQMSDTVEAVSRRLGRRIPVLVDGQSRDTGTTLDSVDPADPATVVGTAAMATEDDVDVAIDAAVRQAGQWARTSPSQRAGILFRAAHWMRARRFELAAMQVFEVGKPWADADADVCEAIDYCEFYGREALRLGLGGVISSPPGEVNRLLYEARGVVAVISPWNFPLAIPAGMTTGALAAGNTVILKPAEQSPATAFALVEALLAAGLPPGALAFLPGNGETVGRALVDHPQVDVISFTGSREVGLAINEIAARRRVGARSVKKVLAEMGGKNAIVVDADANLDEAVSLTVRSAFGFAGQKCSAASRVIADSAIYDRLAERLVGATQAISIGHPRNMGTQMGPLVEQSALDRVLSYRSDPGGTVLLVSDALPGPGYFASPMIVGDVEPDCPLARDEIFGPVLALFRANDFDHAIHLANATDYSLTAGVVSRSPRHIRRASTELRAGNVYVNRPITGAVVGRQPFGGSGLSGVGSKAGGPDYVVQFTNPRVISENTMRHGFAPVEGSQ